FLYVPDLFGRGALPEVERARLFAWLIDRLCEPELFKGCIADQATKDKLLELSARDKSAQVRMAFMKGLQRLPHAQRWELLDASLVRRAGAIDYPSNLLFWYAFEPLAADDPEKSLALLPQSKFPLVREHVARRIASLPESKMPPGGLDAIFSLARRNEESSLH